MRTGDVAMELETAGTESQITVSENVSERCVKTPGAGKVLTASELPEQRPVLAVVHSNSGGLQLLWPFV